MLNNAFGNQQIITENFTPIPFNTRGEVDENDIQSGPNVTVSSQDNEQIIVQYQVNAPIIIEAPSNGLFSLSTDGKYILVATPDNRTVTIYNLYGVTLRTYRLPQNFNIQTMAITNNQINIQGVDTSSLLNKQYTFNFNPPLKYLILRNK